MKLTRKCYGCKEEFRKTELIQYCSVNSQTPQWYCSKCLEEKQARERFSNKVCEIFGIKSPGPRIWTERKRLRDDYGYTDDTIIDCLEYIYNVKKFDKLSESLTLIKPTTMMDMLKWKNQQRGKAASIAAAISNTKIETEHVSIQENNKSNKIVYENFDDLLNDD